MSALSAELPDYFLSSTSQCCYALVTSLYILMSAEHLGAGTGQSQTVVAAAQEFLAAGGAEALCGVLRKYPDDWAIQARHQLSRT